MSDLIAQVVEIEELLPHPNADKLQIAAIPGWEIIVGVENYSVGDTVVHVQPETMVPRPLAVQWGVDPYLSWKGNVGDDAKGRVKAARLRGTVSFGFLAPNDTGAEVGTNLAEHYGLSKYEPPASGDPGRVRNQHPLFHRYTNIQNLRNNMGELPYNTDLVVTEKIHGTNSRFGWVRSLNEDGEFEYAVGSHNTQRQEDDAGLYGLPLAMYGDQFVDVLAFLSENYGPFDSVLFFGEIFGAGVQDLHYGAKDAKEYQMFDIAIDGKYLPFQEVFSLGWTFGIPTVPILSKDVKSFDDLLVLAEGNTTLNDDHIREGIVVRPYKEEMYYGRGGQNRIIFKLISGAYLTRKGGTEFH